MFLQQVLMMCEAEGHFLCLGCEQLTDPTVDLAIKNSKLGAVYIESPRKILKSGSSLSSALYFLHPVYMQKVVLSCHLR